MHETDDVDIWLELTQELVEGISRQDIEKHREDVKAITRDLLSEVSTEVADDEEDVGENWDSFSQRAAAQDLDSESSHGPRKNHAATAQEHSVTSPSVRDTNTTEPLHERKDPSNPSVELVEGWL